MAKSTTKEYPVALKVAWRYLRVFMDGALGIFTAEVIVKLFGMELDQSAKFAISMALGAGFGALAKKFREEAENYEALVHKLPL